MEILILKFSKDFFFWFPDFFKVGLKIQRYLIKIQELLINTEKV